MLNVLAMLQHGRNSLTIRLRTTDVVSQAIRKCAVTYRNEKIEEYEDLEAL